MSTVYIVMRAWGEYSDRIEWPIVAYHKESYAEDHVLQATARAQEIFLELNKRITDSPDLFYDATNHELKNWHDPEHEFDPWDDVSYFIREVELKRG